MKILKIFKQREKKNNQDEITCKEKKTKREEAKQEETTSQKANKEKANKENQVKKTNFLVRLFAQFHYKMILFTP